MIRGSQVTWLRSLLCSTKTIKRGLLHSRQYFQAITVRRMLIALARQLLCRKTGFPKM